MAPGVALVPPGGHPAPSRGSPWPPSPGVTLAPPGVTQPPPAGHPGPLPRLTPAPSCGSLWPLPGCIRLGLCTSQSSLIRVCGVSSLVPKKRGHVTFNPASPRIPNAGPRLVRSKGLYWSLICLEMNK